MGINISLFFSEHQLSKRKSIGKRPEAKSVDNWLLLPCKATLCKHLAEDSEKHWEGIIPWTTFLSHMSGVDVGVRLVGTAWLEDGSRPSSQHGPVFRCVYSVQ